MVCCAEKLNHQLKSAGGTSGLRPFCTTTLAGFFIEDAIMKQIPLTQGKVALVDDEDFEWLNQWKWCAIRGRKTWYAARGEMRNKKTTYIRMHREILKTPKGMDTDHKDHNGLNNCRNNLRIATNSQNQHNQLLRGIGTSKYKGVSWDKGRKKWRAVIRVNKKTKSIGRFTTEVAAAKAYDCRAKKLYGEYACVNF